MSLNSGTMKGWSNRSPLGEARAPTPLAVFETSRVLALLGVGTMAVAMWAGVVLTVPPQRLLTYLAFFIPFWAFVACYGAAALYWITGRVEFPHPRALGNSVREGALISFVVSGNLAFVAAHRWTFLVLVIAAGLALALELIARFRSASADPLP